MISEQSVLTLSFASLWLQVGPIKIFPLYSTLPPQQQQKIFEPVSFPFLADVIKACDSTNSVAMKAHGPCHLSGQMPGMCICCMCCCLQQLWFA